MRNCRYKVWNSPMFLKHLEFVTRGNIYIITVSVVETVSEKTTARSRSSIMSEFSAFHFINQDRIFSTAVSCAITSHPSVRDCCCWYCQHCGQKLTSKLNVFSFSIEFRLS